MVSPNPLVGAAFEVFPGSDSKRSESRRRGTPSVGSTAAHLRFGEPHAESLLLDRAGPAARGATVYVTLEPCSHHGKTGPCADRLVAAGVSKVVIATLDPNPRVRGQGAARLRQAGIEVEVGAGAREALAVNLPYFMSHLWGRAWIELKEAISLDGRVADDGGSSRWITGEASRREVHRQRAAADALVVGAGTVAADDPELTVRDAEGSTPTRIVIDSQLRTSPTARIWQAWRSQMGSNDQSSSLSTRRPEPTQKPASRDGVRDPDRDRESHSRTGLGNFLRDDDGRYVRRPRLILATVRDAPSDRIEEYRSHGWEVWLLPPDGARIALSELSRRAAREGFLHLLIEAGPGLAQAFLEADLIDALTLYIAPRILGGRHGWTGAFRSSLAEAPELEMVSVRAHGPDLCWRLRRAGILEKLEQRVLQIG